MTHFNQTALICNSTIEELLTGHIHTGMKATDKEEIHGFTNVAIHTSAAFGNVNLGHD